MKYIGVDPGKSGAIVIINPSGDVSCSVTPVIGKEIDWSVFADLLRQEDCHVFLEHVHAIYGSSANSTFVFGGCFEGAKAIIAALRLPFTLVQPKAWQKVMYQGVPEMRKPPVQIKTGKRMGQFNKGKLDTKKMSLVAVKRLFPHVSLFRTPRCTTEHNGIVDALLLAEYGRRLIGAGGATEAVRPLPPELEEGYSKNDE